jgi:16S rRNA processing protein RimM
MRSVSEGRLVPLGEIVGTHGVGGLLRLHPYSAVPAAFAAARTVYLSPRMRPSAPRSAEAAAGPPPRALTLLSASPHGRVYLLRFEGVERVEDAETLVGTVLSLAEADLPPPGPHEFYAYKLEGLEVVTEAGDRLGKVESLFPTGSNDVLVVRDGAREHLIPVIADVIRTIDFDGGRVVITPIAGLLE